MILHGYGRLTWPAARAHLDGCACTWTDLDGIHVTDSPPAELPIGATHLWGWRQPGAADCWVRVRFDGDMAYVAVLTDTEDPHADVREPVALEQAEERTAALWGENDRRVSPLPDDIAALTWKLTQVPGEHPVTFVRAEPAG